jgi:hypothetical protein
MFPRAITFYDVYLWISWMCTINHLSEGEKTTLAIYRANISLAINMYYGGDKYYTERNDEPKGFIDLPMPPIAQRLFTELVLKVASWKNVRLL